MLYYLQMSPRGEMYNVNRIGPKMLPCKIPCFDIFLSDFAPSVSRFPTTMVWE